MNDGIGLEGGVDGVDVTGREKDPYFNPVFNRLIGCGGCVIG